MNTDTSEAVGEWRWGVLPESKIISGSSDLVLESEAERTSTAATLARAIEGNRWVEALRGLGHQVEVGSTATPVEEGETSLNPGLRQALASLLPCAGECPGSAVLGNMAFGNHSLLHTLEGMALGFADPPSALRALSAATAGFGPDAWIDRLLSQPAFAKARGELKKWKALRDSRTLRFPAAMFEAPDPDTLRRLTADLGLGDSFTRTVLAVREIMHSVGLASVADLFLVTRAVLIREFAALVDIDARSNVPMSLEHLIATTTRDLADKPLSRWVDDHHAGLRRHLALAGTSRETRGAGVYRVLNYYSPEGLLNESEKSIAGRQSAHGWTALKARFSDGTIVRDTGAAATRPVIDLLNEGFGLSGKLVYYAVSRVNGGRVCNLIINSRPDVFSALADEARPNRILPLARLFIASKSMDFRTFNFWGAMDWIWRSPDPRGVARRLFREFSALVHAPIESPSTLLMGPQESGRLAVVSAGTVRMVT